MRLIIFTITLLSVSLSFTQINHTTDTLAVGCTVTLFDEGGDGPGTSGNYSDNLLDTLMLVFPNYVTHVQIEFPLWDMEVGDFDTVSFYSGDTNSLLGHYSTASPPTLNIANDTIIITFLSDGLTNEAGFEMTLTGLFNSSTALSTDLTCAPSPNGEIILSANGGVFPYQFSEDSTNFQGGNTFSGLTAGTYDDLLIQDANGCIDSIDAITIVDNSIAFNFTTETVADISCNALTDGSINVVMTAPAGSFDFAWSEGTKVDGNISSNIGSLSAGNYSLTVSLAADTTCLVTHNYTIIEPSAISASNLILDTISCNNICDGSLQITALGGTPPYQYSLNFAGPYQASNILSNLCDGVHNFYVRDANLCVFTDNETLIEPAVLTIGTTGTDPTGAGAGDGAIDATPSGGTTPYTFSWNTAPIQTTEDLSSLDGGSYTVIVTDSNGCTAQTTETLIEPGPIDGGSIAFTGPVTSIIVCHGNNSLDFLDTGLPTGGTGSYTYTWQWSTDLITWNDSVTSNFTSMNAITPTADLFIRRSAFDGSQTGYSNTLFINYVEQVFPTITGLDTTYCQNDPFIVMNGSPTSGTSYFNLNGGSDTLITSLSFFPYDTLLTDTTTYKDTNAVTYTYVDNFGCQWQTGAHEFYIYDTINFDFEFFQTEYVINEPNVYLYDKLFPNPSGGVGVFQGPGVSGDSLFITIAGLGANKSYSYTYTDTTGCISRETDSINIVQTTAITGLGDALFCVTEGIVPIRSEDPTWNVAQPWSPTNPFYPTPIPSFDYFSGFKIYDNAGGDLTPTALTEGAWDSQIQYDYDTILLDQLPLTPGQFVDTFRIVYQYQNKIQNGNYSYWDWRTINFWWFSFDIWWKYTKPRWAKTTYDIEKFIYVEHIDTAGNFDNLSAQYCQNGGNVNILTVNHSPVGGVSSWDILGVTNDGFTNDDQTTVTFDPLAYNGNLDQQYTIEYTYQSPLLQCSQTISDLIEVTSVASLTLSTDNAVSVALPSQLCLGLADTIFGYADGTLIGNFTGNNINNDVLDDGTAILNTTSTGPVINEPITFTYTDANGCTVDSTWTFTVHDSPVLSFQNQVSNVCYGDSVLLEGLGDGNDSLGNFYSHTAIIDTTEAGFAYFNASLVPDDSSYTYVYEYTDGNNCSNSISGSIYVNALPIPTINIDGNEFCSNEIANVSATPLPGIDDSIYYNTSYVTYEPTGFYSMDASTFPQGMVYAEYFYIDNNGCKAYAIDSTLIYPTPTADFSFNSNCITDTIDFIDNSVTNGASIAAYSWIFSDGYASSAQDTSVLFQTPGQKVITFTLTTNAGCQDQYQLIEWFGDKPRVDFDWTNECLIGAVSNTQFVNNTPAIDSVTTWSWTFGDPGNSTSSLANPLFDYTANGSYLITLIGETDYGCIDTAEKAIWIRDYVQSYPYLADFETGNYGWVPDTLVGVNNSWEWGTPDPNGTINTAYSGSNVLMTGLNDNHNNQEYSFIVSPCFDFSQLKRPMIKVKLWGETNQGDGLKMEYNKSNSPDPTDYHPLGTVGKGINWYDDFVTGLIETDPLNTTSPEGWFGSSGGWVDARYQLDTLVGDSMVRIKIIFGSDVAQSLDGFAIDDIWIGERERTVLVEHFTDYNDGTAQTATPSFDGIIQDPFLNDNTMDLVNVQYHVRQTQAESINAHFPSGPAARSNYYGLDSIPYVINDGISFRGDVADWTANIERLEARTLIDPQFRIQLNVTNTGSNITVGADFTANEDLGNREIVVRMAIVEDNIPGSLTGSSYNHRHTLIDFLPGPSGTSFTQNWTMGTTGTLTETAAINAINDPNNTDVVVWIQDKDTKEVFQASSGTISTILGLTGVHEEGASMDFIIYPNPTSNTSTILLNNEFTENGEIIIHDGTGRMIEKIQIDKFNERINLANTNYTNGVYFVSVVSPDGQMLTKKMIIQKN
jgi:hypothetical protein